MKLDILAFAAHPDDLEISASGTIAKMIDKGFKVGIIDLTKGELGTRGSAELRNLEAQNASSILGISARENLDLGDGFFEMNEENKRKIITTLRKYKPDIVLANSITDRHPDHGRGSKLVSEACFLSGLIKIETHVDGQIQESWRPRVVYHYIQDYYIKPDFVIDISDYMDKKIDSIKAYSSQFFDPESDEPNTPISGEDFFNFIKARAREMGRPSGFKYGEGFTAERPIGVKGFEDLI